MLKLSQVNSDQTKDYDIAAPSYDNYYSKYLGKSAFGLLEKLPVTENQQILDLACGTGFFTIELAKKVGQNGKIFAVDLSSGMLDRNQEKATSNNLSNIVFIQSDVLEFLSSFPDNSVDGIVCGWGICYMDHGKLSRELERVTKPDGFLGLIENRACSLKDVSDVFTQALLDYPEAMQKNVVLHLPKDKHYLTKTFCKYQFQVQDAWDGEIKVPCKNGSEVADYMLKSGASAGFLNALDSDQVEPVFKSFIRFADERFQKGNGVLVKHDFCALIGIKSS
jgi:ubiquinone/menaquinone biosynthesis C-methylase UbiE